MTSPDLLESSLEKAAAAAGPFGALPPAQRGHALRLIAGWLDTEADSLVDCARGETHLPEARLRAELARTSFQLRQFAAHLSEGDFLDVTVDLADASWGTGPRPDLRRVLHPLGPVLIFAASNFPFAFSVAGGDTAAALAAGCPVLLKAHPGHPKLSRMTATLVRDGLAAAAAPAGTFALIEGDDAGRSALIDRRIRAAAFTGSTRVGRLLFDLAAARPDPIPFYGELGSTNPVLVTPRAAATRGEKIWADYVNSFTFSAGQLCTKPGLLLAPEATAEVALAAFGGQPRSVLLNERIESAYQAGLQKLLQHPAARVLGPAAESSVEAAPEPEMAVVPVGGRVARPVSQDAPKAAALSLTAATLVTTSVSALLADLEGLGGEVFGPVSVIASYTDPDELRAAARAFPGQLTATVHGDESDPADLALARELLTELAQRAGRVIWNGWPTGVSVTPAMTHGGPFPATTSQYTSVGTSAIARFLRPVTFQSVPEALLPPALQSANPWQLPRRTNAAGNRQASLP
ncbi:aldehyde dehydrogenase (NADP(+)) [Parafrankia sp. FMc6]|uniref:aldehyde dehydrogenase (NADP(+)) n=1 Tax=Parafrankia soli TaxID=2599596 RepID=UPI0034D3E449